VSLAYVYCRAWLGFSPDFPFDKFNSLADDQVAGALEKHAREWLDEHPADFRDRRRKQRAKRREAIERRRGMALNRPGRWVPNPPAAQSSHPGPRRRDSLGVGVFRLAGFANIGEERFGHLSPSRRVFLAEPLDAPIARNLLAALQDWANQATEPEAGKIAIRDLRIRFGLISPDELSLSERAQIESGTALLQNTPEDAILHLVVTAAAPLLNQLQRLRDERRSEDSPKQPDWKRVQSGLLNMRAHHEPYTSVRQLAARFGCSLSTVSKAIKNSGQLRGWKARASKPATPKAVPITAANEPTDRGDTNPPDPVDAPDQAQHAAPPSPPEDRDMLLEALKRSQEQEHELSPLQPDPRAECPARTISRKTL
jgi:hypothetical protein